MTSTLESVRRSVSGPFVGLLWLTALIAGATAFGLGHPAAIAITAAALATAGVATACWRGSPVGDATRWVCTVALMAEVSLLVFAVEATTKQIDMHMAFFAALAIAAAWLCPVSILLGTVFVAVHHLVLNFAYPLAVFPGGSDFVRVVLHAVILLAQAGVLLWMIQRVIAAMAAADHATQAAQDALAAKTASDSERLSLTGKVDDTRRVVEDSILQTVGAIVSSAKAGDFSPRPQASADLGRLAPLVTGLAEVNELVDGATREFVEVLARLSRGDLTQGIATDYRGRFGELKDALNETVVASLRDGRHHPDDRRRRRLRRPRDQHRAPTTCRSRTEQQASSLEETAATTEELAASVKASAQSSRQAVELAERGHGRRRRRAAASCATPSRPWPASSRPRPRSPTSPA